MPQLNQREVRFRRLYDTTSVKVFAYAYRRTRIREDAQDAFSQTYVIAWNKLGSIEQEHELPWLYRTCRFVIANQHRATRRRSDLADRIGAELAVKEGTVSDSVHSIAARDALRRLDRSEQEILMLSAWEGLSSSEIARVLGCSPVAARVRLHRARRSLLLEMSASDIRSDRSAGSMLVPQIQVTYSKD